jgi:hypothetical protein
VERRGEILKKFRRKETKKKARNGTRTMRLKRRVRDKGAEKESHQPESYL